MSPLWHKKSSNFMEIHGTPCHFSIVIYVAKMWVSVNLTGKFFYGWIKDLEFTPVYTKNQLVSWSDNKELSLRADIIKLKFSQNIYMCVCVCVANEIECHYWS